MMLSIHRIKEDLPLHTKNFSELKSENGQLCNLQYSSLNALQKLTKHYKNYLLFVKWQAKAVFWTNTFILYLF